MNYGIYFLDSCDREVVSGGGGEGGWKEGILLIIGHDGRIISKGMPSVRWCPKYAMIIH